MTAARSIAARTTRRDSYHGQSVDEMKHLSTASRVWALSLLLCFNRDGPVICVFGLPVAQFFYAGSKSVAVLGQGATSSVLLSLEAATVLGLSLLRLLRGRISPFGKALAIASLASICAYGINSNLLKWYFGVPDPAHVIVVPGMF